MPFKCFDVGRVGHFSSKCPYKERQKMKMIRSSEAKLRNIKIRGSLRRRGSTPKRISWH